MFYLDDNQPVYINQHFKAINLCQTEIALKEFDNCIFEGCNFSETVFIKCKFYECKFINCNLSMINISGCSFFDIVFEDSKMIGINWAQAAWPNIKLISPIQFYQCILDHSSFFGLYLREIAIVECIAKEIDLRESDCTEADFTHTDFSKSLFGKTNLTKANFANAQNYSIDIFNNKVTKAKFSLPEATSLLNCLDIELLN